MPLKKGFQGREEYTLVSVPESERKSWIYQAWIVMGCATTLVQIFLGGFLSFTAGLNILLKACLFACPLAALIGWGMGHMAYKRGVSSTFLARVNGFGAKGSAVASIIVAFMMIGFMALENALIYNAAVTFFGFTDTIGVKLVVYLGLSVIWVILASYGFKLMTVVSGLAVCGFIVVVTALLFMVKKEAGVDWRQITSFGSLMPEDFLRSVGATDSFGKWAFCVNVILGSVGPIALFCADIGRYSRSSCGIGGSSLVGMTTAGLMIVVSGIILYAGLPMLAQYYVDMNKAANVSEAAGLIVQSSENVLFAILYFGGFIGSALMIFALVKVQVVNTYGAALSLANLFDTTIAWKPGHVACIVVANIISLIMIFGGLLGVFAAFITFLGSICVGMSSIMMLDYFLVARLLPKVNAENRWFNFAGLASLAISYLVGHYILTAYIPVEAVGIMLTALLVYPFLRTIEIKSLRLN